MSEVAVAVIDMDRHKVSFVSSVCSQEDAERLLIMLNDPNARIVSAEESDMLKRQMGL
jgi:hypothetical protein